jgi:molybdate transport system regulatory protein
MKVSARNQFSGTVKHIVKGPVSAEITVTIASGIDVVAIISTASADNLGLAVGKPAQVLIKASSVLVGVD